MKFFPRFVDDPPAIGLLLLRAVAGTALMLHGYPKLVHAFNWMGMTSQVPSWLQALSPVAEFGGGLALILGLLTPLAAFGIGCNMAGALFLVHFTRNDPFVSANGDSYELALIHFAIALMFIFTGPGRHSIDYWLFGPKESAAEPLPEREFANIK